MNIGLIEVEKVLISRITHDLNACLAQIQPRFATIYITKEKSSDLKLKKDENISQFLKDFTDKNKEKLLNDTNPLFKVMH